MALTRIKGMRNSVYYVPYSDVENIQNEYQKEIYEDCYKILKFICSLLQVSLPDLSILDSIRQVDPLTGLMTEEVGRSITTEEDPNLKNNIVIISLEHDDPLYLTAIMAHEVRHFWQKKYRPNMSGQNAMGYGNSLVSEAEIDADGFAIWYLSKYASMHIEKAAGIVCPEEKKHEPKAYFKRIEKANEIAAEMEELFAQRAANKVQKSKNFIDVIKEFFKR